MLVTAGHDEKGDPGRSGSAERGKGLAGTKKDSNYLD